MKCSICDYRGHTEDHHIQSKSLGGSNKKSNRIHLCPNCHSEVHRGLIVIEGKVMSSAGVKLIFHKKGEAPVLNRELPKCFVI